MPQTYSLTLLGLCITLCSQCSASESLCGTTEVALFSCPTAYKLVSLCASRDLSQTSGYLQYRFGTKTKLDFQYPENKVHPYKKFIRSGIGYARGGEEHISFSNGSYMYVLYDILTGLDPGKGTHARSSGVVVLSKSKAVPVDGEMPIASFVRHVRCQQPALGSGVPDGAMPSGTHYLFPEDVYRSMSRTLLK